MAGDIFVSVEGKGVTYNRNNFCFTIHLIVPTMELLLTFENEKPTAIPIDYHYYLGSWVYGVISKGNPDHATFLHDEGYKVRDTSNKNFKHFTFSQLNLYPFEIFKDGSFIIAKGDTIQLRVRFYIDESLKSFVMGLFKDNNLVIKGVDGKMLQFTAKSVDMLEVNFAAASHVIGANTPIVIAQKREDGSDEYLAPTHERYEELFFNNLLDKYRSAHGELPPEWANEKMSLSLQANSKVKSQLHRIDPSSTDIKIRGYKYEFKLTAPAALITLGLQAGFGKHCAWGFGFGEVMN